MLRRPPDAWTPRGVSLHVAPSLNEVPWQCQCYSDIIMTTMASEITGISIVCSTICSGVDQRKHQSSTSLAFVRGIHWWLVDSPPKWTVMRKMFSFDDIVMNLLTMCQWWGSPAQFVLEISIIDVATSFSDKNSPWWLWRMLPSTKMRYHKNYLESLLCWVKHLSGYWTYVDTDSVGFNP